MLLKLLKKEMKYFVAMRGYSGDVDEISEVSEFLRGLLTTSSINT